MIRSSFAIVYALLLTSVFSYAGKIEFTPDCNNYCAFQEFDKNCHGIKFTETLAQDKWEHYYTHWNDRLKGCLYNRIPKYEFASLTDIKAKCTCPDVPLPTLPKLDAPLKESTAAELRNLREKIEDWAPCAPDPLTIPIIDDQFPYKPVDVKSCKQMKADGKKGYFVLGGCEPDGKHCSYFGNTNCASGPYCLAGEKDRCDDILASQDPETGAWYRSAFERRFHLSGRGQPLFSRDEFLGIMLYFVKTKDKVSAEKWLRFIVNNPKKGLTGTGNLIKVLNICPPLPSEKPPEVPDFDWKRMQPDDRCEMRGDSWALMYRVYRYIGFTNKEIKKISGRVWRSMHLSNPFLGITTNISARSVPAFTYEMGDQALNLMALLEIGLGKKWLIKDAAKVVDRRTAYENPFYHWVAMRGKSTEYGAYLIKKYCPVNKPFYGIRPDGARATPAASFFDSGVHYFGGLKDGWEEQVSVGHDCIGWINLYLGDRI